MFPFANILPEVVSNMRLRSDFNLYQFDQFQINQNLTSVLGVGHDNLILVRGVFLGALKLTDRNLTDQKMTDNMDRPEIDRPEFDGQNGRAGI